MTVPVTIPFTFANTPTATSLPLSNLDTNFSALASALNGLVNSSTGIITVPAGGTGLGVLPAANQILIGTGSAYTLANLVAGSNVTITVAAGNITISSLGGGGGAGTVSNATIGQVAIYTAANTVGGVNTKGTGNVVLDTSTTLITPNIGTPIYANLVSGVNLPLTSGVNGVLPVANGGTNAATLTANAVILGNGTSTVQIVTPGTSGNVLTSNGTTWISQAGGAASSVAIGTTGVTTGTYGDILVVGGTTAAPILSQVAIVTVPNGGTGLSSVTANAILAGNGTGSLVTIAPGTTGNILTSNGTNWISQADVDDVTIGTTNVNSSTSGQPLYANATGKLVSYAAVPVGFGGTNLSTITANAVILGNGVNTVQVVAPGTSGNVLTSNGTTWISQTATAASSIAVGSTAVTSGTPGDILIVGAGPTLSQTATINVAQGGTGLATITANAVVLGNTTGAVQVVAPGTSGNVLTSNGTTWISQTAGVASSIGIGTTTVTSGTTGYMLYVSGTTLAQTVSVPASAGGTGLTTVSANAVMIGNGTGSVVTVAPGTTGNVLTSNGTNWVSSVGGSAAAYVSIRSVAISNTIIQADNANVVEVSAAATITLPTGLTNGTSVLIVQTGTGAVTLSSNGTLHTSNSWVTLAGQYSSVTCYYNTSGTTWTAIGSLSPP